MVRTLRIFAALLFLVLADFLVVAFASFVCLSAAWLALTPASTSAVVRALSSEPLTLVTRAPGAPGDLPAVAALIGIGAVGVLVGLVVETFRDVVASPTPSVRIALTTLLIRGALLTVLVPLSAVIGVWAAGLLAVRPTLRWVFFAGGGILGFGVYVLFLYALHIAAKPRPLEVLRGRARDDRHA